MATVKISELSSSANITADDFFPVVDSSVTKKATAAIMKDFVLGRSGSNDTVHISSSADMYLASNNLIQFNYGTELGSLVELSDGGIYISSSDGVGMYSGFTYINNTGFEMDAEDGYVSLTSYGGGGGPFGESIILHARTVPSESKLVNAIELRQTKIHISSSVGSIDLAAVNGVTVTGSLSVTKPITGSIQSSSYAQTASYALNGGSPTSDTTFLNIAAMTPNQTTVGTITDFGKSFMLFSATTNTDIRVRLYGSASYRNDDLSRPIGTNPPQNSGVITDLALSGSSTLFDFTLSPVAIGTNRDPVKTSTIYYTVTNLSGTTTDVSMSFNRLVLE